MKFQIRMINLIKIVTIILVLTPALSQSEEFAVSDAQAKVDLMSDALKARSQGNNNAAKDYLEELLIISPNDKNALQLLDKVNNELSGISSKAAVDSSTKTTKTTVKYASSGNANRDKKNIKAKKQILMTEAKRARAKGDSESAKSILEEILAIDSNDKKARKLLYTVNAELKYDSTKSSEVTKPKSKKASRKNKKAVGLKTADKSKKASVKADKNKSKSSKVAKKDKKSGKNTVAAKSKKSESKPKKKVSAQKKSRKSKSTSNKSVSAAHSSDKPQLSRPVKTKNLITATLQEESKKYDKNVISIREQMQTAYVLASQQNFDQAQNTLDEALLLAKDINEETLRSDLINFKGDIYLTQVDKFFQETEIDKAREALDNYKRLLGTTEEYQSYSDQLEIYAKNPNRFDIDEINPNFSNEQRRLQDFITKGKAQFIAGDYDGAQVTFSQIEAEDPNNTEAKYFLDKIAQKELNKGYLDHQKTKNQMLQEVSQGWQRPQIFEREAPDGGIKGRNITQEKLEAIEIPRVNFSGVPLSRVIDTLSELSLEYDTTDKSGVNIVLIDPSNNDPKVNITLRKLKLHRILDFVVESVGYEYDVQDDAVVVRLGAGQGSRLETEFFPISRSTIIRLTGIGAGNNSISAENIDPFAPSAETTSTISIQAEEEKALKDFLQRAGVQFDSVPNANLAMGDGQLIVTNTSRNIEKVGNILRRYNDIKQVEIEAKFLEISQGNLEEFGIDWLIKNGLGNNRLDTANRNLTSFSINNDTSVIEIAQATGTTRDTISPPNIPGAIDLASDITGSIGTLTGIIGDLDVTALIRALSREEGSDLMSAPKVTVLSGKTANITVAQELRYPESYGDTEAEVGSGDVTNSSVAITTGTPQDFVVRNVGVEMEVTPTVEDDSSISLNLNPKVTEFEGFVEYGGPSVAISNNSTVRVPSGFYQPIFSVREVRTEVTIWDGATVVMGGLTREEVKTVKDKVPVLGDVPLFGRLFRSEGETTLKRNLLIFVTANLISPGGSPARQQFTNVEPGTLFQNPTIVTPGRAVSRGAKSE